MPEFCQTPPEPFRVKKHTIRAAAEEIRFFIWYILFVIVSPLSAKGCAKVKNGVARQALGNGGESVADGTKDYYASSFSDICHLMDSSAGRRTVPHRRLIPNERRPHSRGIAFFAVLGAERQV